MATRAPPLMGLSLPSSSSSSSSSNGFVNMRRRPLRTSFVNVGVGSLKISRIQVGRFIRNRCNGHGGGALGAQMNLFDRFARVIKVLVPQKQLENKYKAAQKASEDWYHRAQLALEKGEEDLAREALKRRKSFADNENALRAQLDQQKSVVDNLVSNTRLLESKILEARSKKDTLRARAQSAKFVLTSISLVELNFSSLVKWFHKTDNSLVFVYFRTATKVSEMLGNVNTSSALSAFEKMKKLVSISKH
ncbi:hypothetical protein Scep_029197 [Stephania cephalantha]|uniref:Uncharacterized protein n=1 Tax=Stephania cephalantha TaxID=152367 RepID=A0AAP0HFK7_9MAGN